VLFVKSDQCRAVKARRRSGLIAPPPHRQAHPHELSSQPNQAQLKLSTVLQTAGTPFFEIVPRALEGSRGPAPGLNSFFLTSYSLKSIHNLTARRSFFLNRNLSFDAAV
jgi:hypothetical protein